MRPKDSAWHEPRPVRLSAVLLTLNEEQNVEYCLRSLRSWCDEIVVVDNMSDDRTPQIAARYADVVISQERDAVGIEEVGRQTGLAAASGDWILAIDADEIVTPHLAHWIRSFVDSEPPYDVALIPRANVFLGRWLRSSPWWPGKPRLFRPGALDTSGEIHQGLKPKSGAAVARLPRRPDLSLWHFTRISLDTMTDKTNRYTTIEARQAIAAGRGDPSWFEQFGGALREMLVFIARRGYRDGRAGLEYLFDRMYYRLLAQAKRWDERRAPQRRARYDRWREQILAGFPNGGRVADAPPGTPAEPRRASGPADAATGPVNAGRPG